MNTHGARVYLGPSICAQSGQETTDPEKSPSIAAELAQVGVGEGQGRGTSSTPNAPLRLIGKADEACFSAHLQRLQADDRHNQLKNVTCEEQIARYCAGIPWHVTVIAGWFDSDGVLRASCQITPTADRQSVAEFEVVIEEDFHREGVSGALLETAMEEARNRGVTHLLGQIRPRTFDNRIPSAALNPIKLGNVTLSQFMNYIRENLREDLSLTALAAIAGMTTCQLRYAFKRLAGVSPHQAVTQARIDASIELLDKTRMPISKIADIVGFSSHAHFSSVFSKKMGCSPLACRHYLAQRQEANSRCPKSASTGASSTIQ